MGGGGRDRKARVPHDAEEQAVSSIAARRARNAAPCTRKARSGRVNPVSCTHRGHIADDYGRCGARSHYLGGPPARHTLARPERGRRGLRQAERPPVVQSAAASISPYGAHVAVASAAETLRIAFPRVHEHVVARRNVLVREQEQAHFTLDALASHTAARASRLTMRIGTRQTFLFPNRREYADRPPPRA